MGSSLEYGADIHALNDKALQVACYNNNFETVKLLLESGANAKIFENTYLKTSDSRIEKLIREYSK